MSTSLITTPLSTARVILPPGPIFSKSGQPRVLRALIWRASISQSELAMFIHHHGFGPDGRTERYDGTRSDGLIELERTVPNVRTHNELLQQACVFANQIKEHFAHLEEVTVH